MTTSRIYAMLAILVAVAQARNFVRDEPRIRYPKHNEHQPQAVAKDATGHVHPVIAKDATGTSGAVHPVIARDATGVASSTEPQIVKVDSDGDVVVNSVLHPDAAASGNGESGASATSAGNQAGVIATGADGEAGASDGADGEIVNPLPDDGPVLKLNKQQAMALLAKAIKLFREEPTKSEFQDVVKDVDGKGMDKDAAKSEKAKGLAPKILEKLGHDLTQHGFAMSPKGLMNACEEIRILSQNDDQMKKQVLELEQAVQGTEAFLLDD